MNQICIDCNKIVTNPLLKICTDCGIDLPRKDEDIASHYAQAA